MESSEQKAEKSEKRNVEVKTPKGTRDYGPE